MDFWSNFQTLTGINQVSRICRVSKRTVERWIYGTAKPKWAYMQLLYLHDSGRVMPDKWVGRCRWYQMLERLPLIEARIDAILRVTPSAEVIDLQKYKDELAAAKNRPFLLQPGYEEPEEHMADYQINEKLTHRKNGC